MVNDEAYACWASLVALVDDIHAPQYNLSESQWNAGEQFKNSIPNPYTSVEEEVLSIALHVMFDEIDPPNMSDHEWKIAEQMLVEYTKKVDDNVRRANGDDNE